MYSLMGDKLTIDHISKHAKCSHGIVYHYFRNVDSVVDAIKKSDKYINLKSSLLNVEGENKYYQIKNMLDIYLNLKDEFTNLKSDIEKKQVLIKKGISIQEANKIVKEEKAKRKEENQDIVNRLDRKTIQEYGNKNFIVSASNFASDMTMAILGANGINPIVSNALAQGAKGFAEATASTTNKKDIAVDTISSGAWGAIFNGANNLLGKT